MAKSPDDAILDALKKAASGLYPLQAPKDAGIFPGGAGGKQLVEHALTEGLLTKREEKVKVGKRTTTVVYGIITEKGLRKLIDVSSPKAALEALLPVVEKIGKHPAGPSLVDFKAALETASEKCVGAIQNAFADMQRAVLKTITPTNESVDPGPILAALRAALGKVEAVVVNVPTLAPITQPIAPPPSVIDPVSLGSEIVAFVKQTTAERTVGCDFPELFDHLQKRHPKLTIGTFHDALRALDDAGRIRLKDWPRMQDEMPRPELALFVTHTVMYHVQLSQ